MVLYIAIPIDHAMVVNNDSKVFYTGFWIPYLRVLNMRIWSLYWLTIEFSIRRSFKISTYVSVKPRKAYYYLSLHPYPLFSM